MRFCWLISTNLALQFGDIVHHINWVREMLVVPHEVFVIICVLDIEPQDIERDILFVESSLNAPNIA